MPVHQVLSSACGASTRTAPTRTAPTRTAPIRIALMCALVCAVSAPIALHAQAHQHTPGMTHETAPAAVPTGAVPTQSGQAAFAAIAEVVRMLQADSTTDWTKVNIEALRLHLRDMDLVLMQSRVVASHVEGGVRLEVTGDGEVTEAIRRMLHSHGQALESEFPIRTSVEHHERGLVFIARAKDPANTAYAARLRALGLAGLLVMGDHHAPHHLMIARGLGVNHSAH